MWNCQIIDTPTDGSCFFNAISIALNDPESSWQDHERLRELMEDHWNKYAEESGETPHGVSPDMVRFMCATHLDEESLVMYNAEAEYRRDTEKEKNVKIFENLQQMKDHVRKSNCWADHSIMRAFLASLEYRCCVVVFDSEVGGITHLPEEWTKGKDTYICLRRDLNHYRVIRLIHHGSDEEDREEMPLCLPREVIIKMAHDVNAALDSDVVTNVF